MSESGRELTIAGSGQGAPQRAGGGVAPTLRA